MNDVAEIAESLNLSIVLCMNKVRLHFLNQLAKTATPLVDLSDRRDKMVLFTLGEPEIVLGAVGSYELVTAGKPEGAGETIRSCATRS
jgi:hypothetical protein